nr:CBS domain-containing protein [Waterburya agarophytonicola]
MSQIIDRQPLTVSPSTPLSEAVRLMQDRGNSCRVSSSEDTAASNSSCVLIVEDNRLLGIFTERDLVKLIAREIDLTKMAVEQAMSKEVVALTYTGTEDIFAALNLLRSHRIRHLPIIDADNNLLGLTTVKNLRRKLQPVNMMKWRKVIEVMKTGVIYTDPEDSLRHVAQLMVEHKVSCVAICETVSESDTVKPLGIVTERDIVQFQNLDLDLEQPARDVMSSPLFLVSPDDTLWSIHQQMQQHRVRRLLVGGRQGELAGIVTQTSLLQVFDPSEMYGVIESLQQQVCQLELAQTKLLENRQVELETEIAERTAALRIANHQRKAIAELGQYALVTPNLPLILEKAVCLVADTLEVEYCKVLKLLPDDNLLLEAGVGWHDGLVGTAKLGIEQSSQAGYTLQQSQPVVVDDLRTETHFDGPPLLIDHQVISGISVIIADSGKPYGVLGTHTTQQRNFTTDDVNFLSAIANIIAQANERLQAETALKASEQKFDSILNSLNDIIWSADARTLKLTYINQAAEKIYGYPVAEFYRSENLWLEVIHPDDRDRVSEFPHIVVERGSCEMEYRILRPDGEIRWLLDRANLTRDESDRPLRIDGNSTDITERKQAEKLLEESQERFDLAVRGSRDGLWYWNVTTNEVFYAPRFKAMIGYTDAEMPNLLEAWSSKLHPEDREPVLTAVQHHLEDRTPYNVEYRLQTKQGDYSWFNARGQAIWNEDDEAIRMAGSITDISDRKRRESILKDIASGVTIPIGTNFFSSLVEYLSKTLKIDYAFIGELVFGVTSI